MEDRSAAAGGHKAVAAGGTWKDGNALYLDCMDVNIPIVTFYYNFTRRYHWGKLSRGYSVIPFKCTCICISK